LGQLAGGAGEIGSQLDVVDLGDGGVELADRGGELRLGDPAQSRVLRKRGSRESVRVGAGRS
jgi:hypothetical protein